MTKKLNKNIVNFKPFKRKMKKNKRKQEKIIRFYEFEKLCQMTQKGLKKYLEHVLKSAGRETINNDGYLYSKGNVPVMLIAHMDTVHKELPREFIYTEHSNIISSPQGIGGDDRCGVYMILEIIKELNCHVLFLEDEEIGCVGADSFALDVEKKILEDINVNYLIEFDRRNGRDAVYYDLDNKEFEEFITKASNGHFKTAIGSCSDICSVAPALNVAAVNLSCGYYKEHTLEHTVNRKEMETNIEMAKMIIKTEVAKPFEWKEKVYSTKWDKWFDYKGSSNNPYYDYWDDNYGYSYNGYKKDKNVPLTNEYEIYFIDEDGTEATDYFEAVSEEEALGLFFMNHVYTRYYDVYHVISTDYESYTSSDRFYSEGNLVEDEGWYEKIDSERKENA